MNCRVLNCNNIITGISTRPKYKGLCYSCYIKWRKGHDLNIMCVRCVKKNCPDTVKVLPLYCVSCAKKMFSIRNKNNRRKRLGPYPRCEYCKQVLYRYGMKYCCGSHRFKVRRMKVKLLLSSSNGLLHYDNRIN